MGKIGRKRPRRGSLQYWPRVRARRAYPRINNWPARAEPGLLGFVGYKAGMTHIMIVDARKHSPTRGEELRRPVTVIETPPVRIFGLRVYGRSPTGLNVVGEAWAGELDKDLKRRLVLPKKVRTEQKLAQLERQLGTADQVRVLVHTIPRTTGIGKKRPEVIELAVGGRDAKEQFSWAKSALGKDARISDVFKPGTYLDVHAVTKGKGFQGVIKRFGVKLEKHKSEKGRRKVGTLGNWDAKTWRVAHAGKMGYHRRTEYNKFLFKIADPKEQPINPAGGLVKYGNVKSQYALIDGSLPGPKKRLLVLTYALRTPQKKLTTVPEIIGYSLRSQQG